MANTKKTKDQSVFLPLAKVHDGLSKAVYTKRMEKQADTMRAVRNELFDRVYTGLFRLYGDDFEYGHDFSSTASDVHIEFKLLNCGDIHIDLSINGHVAVHKFGGGSDFLPFARPNQQFTGEYNADEVAAWIVQAIDQVKQSVKEYYFQPRQ